MARGKAQNFRVHVERPARKIRKSIPPLVSMPTSTPHQQETHISPSGADDERSTEVSNVPKTSSLHGGQNGIDPFTALDVQARIDTAVERDENGLNLEPQDFDLNCSFDAAADSGWFEETPVADYYCSTASKRKSTSPEAPQLSLCQSNHDKRRKSCKWLPEPNLSQIQVDSRDVLTMAPGNLDSRVDCSRSQSPKLPGIYIICILLSVEEANERLLRSVVKIDSSS
jgi:hypothetical protein